MARHSRSTISSPATRSTDPATAYAHQVVDGKIVAGRMVRLACARHLTDLERGSKRGLKWRPDRAVFVYKFFRNYLRHSKGEWAGKALELAPWQQFIFGSVFGWYRVKDDTRRFRTIWEEVARKNGKSTSAAAIGILGLVADREPGAEVYAAATRRDQARIIFEEARRMVRGSEFLRAKIGIFKLNMSIDQTSSKFEPLSADEKTLDGLNPHFVLIDEIHKHKNRAVIDVLDTALGSRRQPLIWMITTAGDDNPESVYAQENDYAIKVLEGVVKDDSYFAYVATIDKGDDWKDPKVWIKANPNLGISVKRDDLRRQALKAEKSPSALVAFKRLRLNVRTAATTRAIDIELWRKNSLGKFDPASLAGRSFYGGLDLSSKIDLTAWVKLFPPLEPGDRWKIVPRFWVPADTVSERSDRDGVQYRRWIDAGLIEVTPGNIIDHLEVQNAILEDCRIFDCRSLAYDPWNATQLAIGLQAESIEVAEFVQGIRSYTAPTKELEAMLLSEKLDHGGNEVLAWMAHNLHVQIDKNENKMPSKKHSTGRIDGLSGLIMAIGRALIEEGSPYDDGRDLLVLG